MKVGDYIHGGIYAGKHNGHYVICSLKEYECPVRLNWYQANEYCRELVAALPTIEELNLLYELSKIAPGQFSSGKWPWYWSSTEDSLKDVWVQYFSNGYQHHDNKPNCNYVRAVRRIKI